MIGATLKDGREVRILFQHNDFKKKAMEIAREIGIDPEVAAKVGGYASADRNNKEGHYKVYSHSTLCEIVVGERGQEVPLAQGESWCAVGDNFCRATGREYALRRAIENGGFGREDVGTLLASYFNRNRGKRTKETV